MAAPQNRGGHASTAGRLAALDTEVGHLSSAFASFSTKMEQRTERLEQSIERLGEAVVSSRNVDWKTIIATCSLVFMLVVTIGGTLTAWTTTQVGSVDDQVRRNADELRERAADIYAVGEVKSRLSLLYDSVKGLEAHMGDRWTRSDHDEKTVPALESLRRDLHELEVRFAAGGVPR